MISILERQNIIIIKCSFTFIYSFQWNIFEYSQAMAGFGLLPLYRLNILGSIYPPIFIT